MKKFIITICTALLLISCNKGLENNVPAKPENLKLDFTIVDGSSPDTRAIKTDWIHGDKVYVFFADEVSANGYSEQYLVIKYDRHTTGWYADYWTDGLEAKIAAKTSGTLSLLYIPNDKVGGSMDVDLNLDQTVYYLYPKDAGGKEYCSYALQAVNVNYKIVFHTLTVTATMEEMGKSFGQMWNQFTIINDRSGDLFTNDGNLDRYTLSHKILDSGGYIERDRSVGILVQRFSNNGNFYYDDNGQLSAYFYAGLAFAGKNFTASNNRWHIFTLTDNKGTDSTGDDVKYEYKWPEGDSCAGSTLPSGSVILPDLNAKDGTGKYKWVVKQ